MGPFPLGGVLPRHPLSLLCYNELGVPPRDPGQPPYGTWTASRAPQVGFPRRHPQYRACCPQRGSWALSSHRSRESAASSILPGRRAHTNARMCLHMWMEQVSNGAARSPGRGPPAARPGPLLPALASSRLLWAVPATAIPSTCSQSPGSAGPRAGSGFLFQGMCHRPAVSTVSRSLETSVPRQVGRPLPSDLSSEV